MKIAISYPPIVNDDGQKAMVSQNRNVQFFKKPEHLGDVLLFLIDRTDDSTTPVSEQEHLLEEVRGLLSDRRVLVVSTKSDLIENNGPSDDHSISSITGEGLEDLRSVLIEIIDADRVEDPLTLPDHWPRQDEA